MLTLAAFLATTNAQAGCMDAYCKILGRRRAVESTDDAEMPRLDLGKALRVGFNKEEDMPAFERFTGPYGKLDMPKALNLDQNGMIPLEMTFGEMAPVCPEVSPKWSSNVAHATHSVALEDLQEHFNPRVTWENKVMTLARDAVRVMEHAPENIYPAGAPFMDRLLNKLAYHMEQREHSRMVHGNWNAFGVMIHVLHMREIMLMVKEHYHKVNPSEITCHCMAKHDDHVRKELLSIGEYFMNDENTKKAEAMQFPNEWKVGAQTLEQVRRDSVFMKKTPGFAKDAAIYLKCKLRHF